MKCTIIDSIFQFISKNGNGGAIEINTQSTSAHVLGCHFESINVNQSGGSIFLSTFRNIITNCHFFRSYSSAHQNDNFLGNAIYIENGNTTFANNAVYRCAFDKRLSTDSSVRINSFCSIESYNASSNAGYEGGSGFSLRNGHNSIISYIQVIDSLDDYSIEDANLKNEFSYINFINTTKINHAIIFLQHDDILTLNRCIFIESFHILSVNATKIRIISCYSDSNFQFNPGIIIQDNPSTLPKLSCI